MVGWHQQGNENMTGPGAGLERLLGGWQLPNNPNAAAATFDETITSDGIFSWNAIPLNHHIGGAVVEDVLSRVTYRVYAFERGKQFPVNQPAGGRTEVWAGGFNGNDDATAVTELTARPVSSSVGIDTFTVTNNTHLMTMLACAYADVTATPVDGRISFDVTTMGLTPGVEYYLRVQAIAPDDQAPLSVLPPENGSTGPAAPLQSNLSFANSLLSGVRFHSVSANVVIGLDFPTFTAPQAPPLAVPEVATATTWRTFTVNQVTNATGFNIYAFASREDAESGDPTRAVAVARNLDTSTTPSDNAAAPSPGENQFVFDVRLLQFENVGANDATRALPAGYIPADIGVSQSPGVFGEGNTSNLRPGMYWFRVSAVNATAESAMAAMGTLTTQGNTNNIENFPEGPVLLSPNLFSIGLGPSEGRSMIEALVADGGVAGVDFHVFDIRTAVNPGLESANEGLIRFTNPDQSQPFGLLTHLPILGGDPRVAGNDNADIPIFLY